MMLDKVKNITRLWLEDIPKGNLNLYRRTKNKGFRLVGSEKLKGYEKDLPAYCEERR